MAHQFAAIAFTESVRQVQQEMGSRAGYAAMDEGEDHHCRLGEREAEFIAERDSFYMASVGETGWPYVQHRGGPVGFVRILDDRTIGFADFQGNRQYVTVGNVRNDNRVSLFFMDYPNRTRLKLLGRVEFAGLEDTGVLARLEDDNYRAEVERGFVIRVEAFDWNCPQHITPRYTQAQVDEMMAPAADHVPELTSLSSVPVSAKPASLGDGPLTLVVSGVRQLTPRIRAYELRDPEGGELPEVLAGSHLEVPVRLADGSSGVRNYSICSNPGRRDIYELAVLREDDGTGGSQAVHQQFGLGLRLNCQQPRNHFRLHDDTRPSVLIAGGIGITPIKAMAQSLDADGRRYQLHYAGRSATEMAFRDRLQRAFGDRLTVYTSDDGRRMDVEQVVSSAPDDAVFYVCGPARLIEAVTEIAEGLGVDPCRVRSERFAADVPADARPVEVELRRTGVRIHVPADTSILDAMLDAGVGAPFSCRAGNCRTCAVKVLDGEPDHRDTALTDFDRDQAGLMCPCVSRAVGESIALDI